MSDGAQEGIGAERALDTILGGQPAPEIAEQASREEVEHRIRATPLDDRSGYGSCADAAARAVLEYLEADPERLNIPTENVYETDSTTGNVVFTSDGDLHLVTSGLYERMKQDGVPLSDLGLSGFQWGWAVNCARWILDAPPVPNPAIFTIDVGGEAL